MLSSSSGVYTLGPLECSGKVEVKRLPSSCEDLWRMGHIFSGFHTVMGDKNLDIVYCDFTKSPDQQSKINFYQLLLNFLFRIMQIVIMFFNRIPDLDRTF
jgi:hypothetical protein